ncbi:MAG: succinyl-diaminopimelate desuccinylase [Pseudomonadota bacterium]
MQTTELSPTLQLCCDLIRQESITPNDANCQQIMAERLTALGFDCQTLRYGGEHPGKGEAAVDNLWAVYGDKGPILCFAGHTDVVPPGPVDEWQSPPFEPTIRDAYLYGRGAADMKASLAAMITACESFLNSNHSPTGRIAFLITADEEGPAKYGTVKVVEWLEQQGIKLDWCLVGEPSSTEQVGDVIKNGRRGSLGAVLTVKGKQGHVAYPHLASNPIHRVAPALAELAAEEWDQGNDFFPATSFQISNMNGGTGASNVIPGTVEIVFNFRFSTAVTAEQLKQRTEAILAGHGLQYEIQWHLSGQPFLTAEGALVEACVAAIESTTGRKTKLSTAGGTSDGRFIAPTGAQVVELGPVNASIHQVNERTDVEQLDQLHSIYYHLLKHLLT